MFLLTEIGTRLKEAREAKGYTLSDLQEITKIQKRYLVGIENGDYDSIPGAFYVRAFIRQYAEAVGLDPDELLETYKNEVPSTPSMEATTVIPAQRQKRNRIGGSPSRQTMEALPKIMVGLFVVSIIVIAVWMYMQKSKTDLPNASEDPSQAEYAEPVKPIDTEKEREKEETRKKNEAAAKEEAALKEQEKEQQATKEEKPKKDKEQDKGKDKDKDKDKDKVTQTITEDAANSGGNVTTFNVTGPEQLNFDLSFTGDAWIEVRDAATRATLLDNEGKVYTAGEEIKLEDVSAKSVYIVIGNIETTDVQLNGEKVEYVRQGYPQSLIFNLQ